MLTLSAGQHMKELSLRMTPQAAITGRITDDNNDPVVSATVRVMRYRYVMGRRQLSPAGSATTNDLGEYRIYGLAAGRYYLAARENENNWESIVDASAAPDLQDYVTTYYAGVKDPSAAIQIEITAGAQLRGINLSLLEARAYHIRGRVEGRPEAQISFMPRGQPGFMSMEWRNHGTGPKGSFELNGVLPGAYTLVANSWSENKNYYARQEVEVSDGNIDNLLVSLSPGFELAGMLVAEGTNPPNLDSVSVMLRPRDEGMMTLGLGGMADHPHDGAFTLSDIAPASYNLSLGGLPEGYWIKSIQVGDQEVRDTGIDLSNGVAGSLKVTVAPNAGEVDGTVMNAQQQAATGATVVLVPEPKLRDQQEAYKNTTSDQNGRFSLKSIPPGDYKLFAWEDVEYGAYMDPDFLGPVENRGQSISISEGSRESVQLNLIPGDSAPAGRREK
jgi:Carboxypeptidase regulatory-like domain